MVACLTIAAQRSSLDGAETCRSGTESLADHAANPTSATLAARNCISGTASRSGSLITQGHTPAFAPSVTSRIVQCG
jgi:hypothetical protein